MAKNVSKRAAIGQDIGHSAVKVVAGDYREIFPAAVMPAIALSAPGASERAAADTVSLGGQQWFVGNTALTQSMGRVTDGLRDDWIETAEHKALLKAGYDKAVKATGEIEPVLTLGLPSRLYGRQWKRLREIAALTLQIPEERISVLPQPMGAWLDAAVANGGESLGNTAAIVDIGYYTTDFGAIESGQWSETGSQSIQGVSLAAEVLKRELSVMGMDLDMRQCNAILSTGSIKYDGQVRDVTKQVAIAIEAMTDSIVDGAMRVFGTVIHTADDLLVVGGGASLVSDALRKRWKMAKIPADPRYVVANGLFLFGQEAGD
ncbi:hypothetical protein AB7849_15235 [Rhodanobacter sp. 115]|uniref:ParM/StbA family protein n=1 Tax=Rhodanobacter sp. FW021-MT20 TaxID=1162282 RepID=UPI0034E58944